MNNDLYDRMVMEHMLAKLIAERDGIHPAHAANRVAKAIRMAHQRDQHGSWNNFLNDTASEATLALADEIFESMRNV